MAIDPRFLNSVILKTAIIGVLLAAVCSFTLSTAIGIGVAVGAAVSVLNLRFVVWALGKLFDATRDIGGSPLVWTILLGFKMAILMGIIWILLSTFSVNAVGFTIGFSAFLPAMLWQTFANHKNSRS